MLRPILVLSILILAAASGLTAETPEEVVTRQVEAMRAGDWDKFTACMHGPALQDFQTTILRAFEAAPEDGTRQQLLQTFFGGTTMVDLTAASPSKFFGLFMNGLLATNPTLKQSMTGAEGQILGHIDEPPDKTHVLMRMTMPVGDGKITKMDVTSLQREGDTWKALLKGDMQAVVTNLARMIKPK